MARKDHSGDAHSLKTISSLRLSEDSFLKSSSRDSISEYEISSGNPQKDHFHNLIFGIDNVSSFGIVNLASLINFLIPNGVVDGERPLEVSLHNLKFSSLKSVPSAMNVKGYLGPIR